MCFSSDRFPDAVQPVVRALQLTVLINVLSAVILEGSTLGSQCVVAGWTVPVGRGFVPAGGEIVDAE
jgi:hypothetical protein